LQIIMFTKMLKNVGELPLAEAAKLISQMGFSGADLTVRRAGYVDPMRAKQDLPMAVEILRSEGLDVPLITTEIVDPEPPWVEDVYRAAGELAIPFLKLGYYGYRGFGNLERQIAETRGHLSGLAFLSEEYGVASVIHMHSGRRLNADAAVVRRLLSGFDPQHLAAYIDPGHMVLEGGVSGWEIGMDLLADWIRVVAVKDFGWVREGSTWVVRHYPLSEGLVPWDRVLKILRQIGFDGPMSIHSEYPDLGIDELVEQTKRDLEYLRSLLSD